MKKLSLEYIFRTSPKLLYQRISTASGLNEWFADNVEINHDKLTFTWMFIALRVPLIEITCANRRKDDLTELFCLKIRWVKLSPELLS